MIVLEHLTKVSGSVFNSRKVLSSVNLEIPSDQRIALVGSSAEDRRILVDLLGGVALPTAGRVIRKAEVSFPVGQLPGFSKDLTVRVNVAHVARLYGANVKTTVEIVEKLIDLGNVFDKPYDDMPRQLRKPLAQIVAFAIPFDAYILTDDSLRPVQESRHRRDRDDHSAACYALFQARLKTSGMIIPTDDLDFAREHCEMGMVLYQGRLELLDDVDDSFRLGQEHRGRRRRRRSAS
jgi:capsular polysaccharide transport system ATP-binding protein